MHSHRQEINRQVAAEVVLAQQAEVVVRLVEFAFGPGVVALDRPQHVVHLVGRGAGGTAGGVFEGLEQLGEQLPTGGDE
jgi:hypothetical protein